MGVIRDHSGELMNPFSTLFGLGIAIEAKFLTHLEGQPVSYHQESLPDGDPIFL